MKEFIEKLIGRLEEESHWEESTFDEDGYCNDDAEEVIYLHRAIEIVNQLAEEYGKDTNNRSNADRIRNMTDEELAEWLFKHDTITYCHGRLNTEELLQWLKSKVTEESDIDEK